MVRNVLFSPFTIIDSNIVQNKINQINVKCIIETLLKDGRFLHKLLLEQVVYRGMISVLFTNEARKRKEEE